MRRGEKEKIRGNESRGKTRTDQKRREEKIGEKSDVVNQIEKTRLVIKEFRRKGYFEKKKHCVVMYQNYAFKMFHSFSFYFLFFSFLLYFSNVSYLIVFHIM